MGAPLPDVAELLDVKAILLDRIERRDPLVVRALPMRDAGREVMRKIHEAMRLDGRKGLIERDRLRVCCDGCGTGEARGACQRWKPGFHRPSSRGRWHA